ncbi:MAG TPA: ABC transporter substrate-binding protein [Rhodobacteraceae bacterium]|jgi:TRAP-type C4-dicarboxylate transport system permease small subunit|nr:ABC transporter substrate-binding protein [Paracoccaceae bacterium]HBV55080.1 ABC transporter substrate-binding protein [Paracoccaceae bacterium]
MGQIRRALDALYTAGGVLAALFTVAILCIIVAQMVLRWAGGIFPGGADYAGYCMAAASFFAFAHALQSGSHIRVSLILSKMGAARRWGEVWCFGVGAVAATFLARFAIKVVMESRKFKDVSQGQDATPLWIPQMAMAIGAVILAIAFWDNFIRVLFTGRHGVVEDAMETGKAE